MNQMMSATASEMARANRLGLGCSGSSGAGGGFAGAVDCDSSDEGRRSGRAMTDSGLPALPSRARQRGGVQNLVELSVGEDLLFAHDLEDSFTRFQGLGRELGRLVVPDPR